MRTIVFAYHDIGCIGIKSLMKHGFNIQAVFTHLDSPNENIFFNSVSRLVAQYNIPVFAPPNINHTIWINYIKILMPEIIFSFHYRKLINKKILDIPKIGAFNLHCSLLPRYRGRSPLNWVLINGEQETGVTLHRMIIAADAGNIIANKKVTIETMDDAMTLHNKLCKAANDLLEDSLSSIKNNNFNEISQKHHLANYGNYRTPQDGYINWTQSAKNIANLIRGVTYPWSGAFSYIRKEKFFIWKARILNNDQNTEIIPGSILSIDPLIISCGVGSLEILVGQVCNDICVQGNQLAQKLDMKVNCVLNDIYFNNRVNTIKILILGVNGFIGNHLTEYLLKNGNYEIYGLDINTDAIYRFMINPLFHFLKGDISLNTEWIEYHIQKCDIIFPLVAIATPIEYIRHPLKVFELDFEENLKVIRFCVKYKKRIIFPSTSEVYGMCNDVLFDEDHSSLIVGPINKQRWIYSASKQLLDRVLWAYGEEKKLCFTVFRPFNWIGPRLDNLHAARIGNSRVITQLIMNLIEGLPINLVNGGIQKRCFTDINDGINALFRIIENKNNNCDGKIINIGNPANEISIQQLAKILLDIFDKHPLRENFPPFAGFHNIKSSSYYGKGYQDIKHRKPNILNAKNLLNWTPKIKIKKTIYDTLDFFLNTVHLSKSKSSG